MVLVTVFFVSACSMINGRLEWIFLLDGWLVERETVFSLIACCMMNGRDER